MFVWLCVWFAFFHWISYYICVFPLNEVFTAPHMAPMCIISPHNKRNTRNFFSWNYLFWLRFFPYIFVYLVIFCIKATFSLKVKLNREFAWVFPEIEVQRAAQNLTRSTKLNTEYKSQINNGVAPFFFCVLLNPKHAKHDKLCWSWLKWWQ